MNLSNISFQGRIIDIHNHSKQIDTKEIVSMRPVIQRDNYHINIETDYDEQFDVYVPNPRKAITDIELMEEADTMYAEIYSHNKNYFNADDDNNDYD